MGVYLKQFYTRILSILTILSSLQVEDPISLYKRGLIWIAFSLIILFVNVRKKKEGEF